MQRVPRDSLTFVSQGLVFLYKLVDGITSESFGIEVARKAGIPEKIIELAKHISHKIPSMNNTSLRKQKDFM